MMEEDNDIFRTKLHELTQLVHELKEQQSVFQKELDDLKKKENTIVSFEIKHTTNS